ncbi:hypothetical protein Tco_1343929 [Tanacetum coccineum]
MLAPKCSTYNGRPTFANPRYLKKAQSEKPCLYEIPFDTSDPANRFAPDREETMTLDNESRSKLNKDYVKPYDYTKQNNNLNMDVNCLNKKPNVVPISASKPKRKANKSVATPHKKTVASDTTIQKSKSYHKDLYEEYKSEWNGTVRFGNDQFALILGYGDLIQGNVTIKWVYYVEGLNHNLFSVGQFCNADLESKGYRVYNKRTRLIVESIHIKFDEIKEMMFEHSSSSLGRQCQMASAENNTSGPVPQCLMTSVHISFMLVLHQLDVFTSVSRRTSPPFFINDF